MASFKGGRQPETALRPASVTIPPPLDKTSNGWGNTDDTNRAGRDTAKTQPAGRQERVRAGNGAPPITPKRWPMVRLLGGLAAFSATLTALATAAFAGTPNARPATGGWEVEKGVERPTYAVAEPSRTDLNIDAVVLLCEQGPRAPVVQLRLYLSGNGPLVPTGVANVEAEPKVELAIDNARHPIELLFADEFVVVADASEGMVPLLSPRLLDALEAGRRMELRFHYVQQMKGGRTRPIDAITVVDLRAGPGAGAVAAVRRCGGESTANPQVAHAPAGGR